MGVPGVQGPPGTVGNLWAGQPSPRALLEQVRDAAGDIELRTVVDPRATARYTMNLVGSVLRLQASVVLRSVLAVGPDEDTGTGQEAVRSIA